MAVGYTPRQFAELISTSEQTVTRWCREGTIRAKQFGKLWRIPKSELGDFFEEFDEQGSADSTAA